MFYITQVQNNIKLTNILCNCLPSYCHIFNCSIRQKNRTFATINYSTDLIKQVKSPMVRPIYNSFKFIKRTFDHKYFFITFLTDKNCMEYETVDVSAQKLHENI